MLRVILILLCFFTILSFGSTQGSVKFNSSIQELADSSIGTIAVLRLTFISIADPRPQLAQWWDYIDYISEYKARAEVVKGYWTGIEDRTELKGDKAIINISGNNFRYAIQARSTKLVLVQLEKIENGVPVFKLLDIRED